MTTDTTATIIDEVETIAAQPDDAQPFAPGDRVRLTRNVETRLGVRINKGHIGTVERLASSPLTFGVQFERSVFVSDVFYNSDETIDVLALCEHVTDDDLPTPPPPPTLSALKADADHWKQEHAAEHAQRLELEQKLERAERNWQNFMMKLATIVDFIEVDANEFYGSHAERTGATKLWRAMLNNLLNRYALATPPKPDFTPPTPDEEIPF